jgi:predicted ATPase
LGEVYLDRFHFQSIRVRNLLSFGPATEPLELRPLNVFIGHNGTGKSNLLDVLSILQAAPRDLLAPIQAGGGIGEWLWKGASGKVVGEIEVVASYPYHQIGLRHQLSIAMRNERTVLDDEGIENAEVLPNHNAPFFYYRYQHGSPVLSTWEPDGPTERKLRKLQREDIAQDQSVLSQRRDRDFYPEITYLNNSYADISIYRDWNLGRQTVPRRPQQADLPANFLREDAGNLALVLNRLEKKGSTWKHLLEKLRDADGAIEDLLFDINGGTVQVALRYKGLSEAIPATRISEGTLRYLCLLSILCHPAPPPVVCIEEPELGLHADLLPTVADLLLEASERTQLLVTTHSDVLIDGLSRTPEAVIVCSKDAEGTRMERLDRERLRVWLDDEQYGLGRLWRKGEIGGNRW